MPVPFRLAILNALTECLQGITPDNGYENDLSASVFRGRVAYGEQDPIPMISILEDPKNLEQDMAPQDSDASRGDWNLLVQGFVEDDPLHPTDPAYVLLAEVKQAIIRARQAGKADGNRYLGLGPKSPTIIDIRMGSGVVRPADEFSMKAYFWLPVTFTLAENHEQPFT